MTIPKLSEATLKRYANAKSFERGEDYYHQGAVLSLTQRGSLLLGVVEGNESHPYYTRLEFQDDEITKASCTCAYSFEGWCKHIVATLLTCLRQPAKMIERPTLEQLLDRLNEIQTQQLIQDLVTEQPALLDTIDRFTNRIVPSQTTTSSSKRMTMDTAPYRSRTRHILRDAIRYLEDGCEDDPISEELFDLIQEAQMLIEQGDGHNAIAILEAITATCVENWDDVEEYGMDNDEVAQNLNEILTEAILCAIN